MPYQDNTGQTEPTHKLLRLIIQPRPVLLPTTMPHGRSRSSVRQLAPTLPLLTHPYNQNVLFRYITANDDPPLSQTALTTSTTISN